MAIGRPVSLTSNVASKTISVTATASQTLFTVTGGYRINQLAVFRNGIRLVDGTDYTARDGASVTLLSPATGGDTLEFQIFDDFRVADAIVSAESDQTIYGNLTVAGTLSGSTIGIQSAGTIVGTAKTLNFIGAGNTFFDNGNGIIDVSLQGGSSLSISTSTTNVAQDIAFVGGAGTSVIGIATATNRFVYVPSTGNLGIGTTNPRYTLEVGSVGTSVTTCYVNGDINSSGIKVFGDTTITGISTLGTVQVSSGIITATSGIVTYYGDGTNLTGITTTRIVSGTSNLTVDSSGGPISATVGGQNVFNVTGTGVTMTDGKRFDVSSYSENVQQLGSVSGTVNLGIGTHTVFIADISGTTSVSFQYQSGSMVNGRLFSGTLILRFSGTGTRNVSLTSLNPKYIGGTGPTYSTTAVTDILSFFTPDNGATTYVNVVGQGFA